MVWHSRLSHHLVQRGRAGHDHQDGEDPALLLSLLHRNVPVSRFPHPCQPALSLAQSHFAAVPVEKPAFAYQSLGSFVVFQEYIPASTREQLLRICHEMQLDVCYPLIYPSIDRLTIEGDKEEFVEQYRLFRETAA